MNEFFDLVGSIGLIMGGIYLRVAKEKEINAPKKLWLFLIILGLISLILKLIL